MEVLGNGSFGDWSSSRGNRRRGSMKKAIVDNSSQVLLVVNGAVDEGWVTLRECPTSLG